MKKKIQRGGFYLHPAVVKMLGGSVVKKKRRNKKMRQKFSYKKWNIIYLFYLLHKRHCDYVKKIKNEKKK